MSKDQRVGHLDNRLKSKGCFSCIRMKVKCDKTRPHCLRCTNARRECPGYRTPGTTFVVDTGGSKHFTWNAQPTSITPRTDWTDNAVNHYVHQFVLLPGGGLPGIHDNVPAMYSHDGQKPYLQSAIQAVALANLARVKNMGLPYLVEAQRLYGQAIQGLRLALSDTTEGISPAALMTTEVLWQYDLIIGESESSRASAHRHGTNEILRQRLENRTEEPHDVTQTAFKNLLLYGLGSTSSPPIMPPPFELYPSTSSPENLACRLLGTIHLIVSLKASPPPSPDPSACNKAQLKTFSTLNEELSDFETTLPVSLRYVLRPAPTKSHRPPASTSSSATTIKTCSSYDSSTATATTATTSYPADEPPTPTITFPSTNAMLFWSIYWIARLDVLLSLHDLLSFGLEKVMVQTQMALTVEKICASVPNLTGQLDVEKLESSEASPGTAKILGALFATRSLYMGTQVPGISTERRRWIARQLEVIGRERGIGQALVWKDEVSLVDEVQDGSASAEDEVMSE